MSLHSLVGFLLLVLSLLAFPRPIEAQPPATLRRIGVLTEPSRGRADEAFRRALQALGYVEGQHLAFVWRVADTPAQYPALATELVALNVDLILAMSGTMALVAKRATSTIPIVFAGSSDAVGTGLVASLAHPGGNLTGFTSAAPNLSGKALELLKETIPRIARVAIFVCGGTPQFPEQRAHFQQEQEQLQGTAQRLGLHLQWLEVQHATPAHFEGLFAAAVQGRADAVQTLDCGYTNAFGREQLVGLAAQHRMPGMYHSTGVVRDGGLMSYAPNFAGRWPRVALYVDKLLKGAKPADLPVEQPTRFHFAINVKTAAALGLTIPPMVLFQADEVIQ